MSKEKMGSVNTPNIHTSTDANLICKYPTIQCMVPVNELVQTDKFRVFEKRDRLDLLHSLNRGGIIKSLTAIKRNGETIVIKGHSILDLISEMENPPTEVPVEIYTGDVSDTDVLWIISHLNTRKKMGMVDLLNMYHVLDKLIPSNQGKRDVEKERIVRICEMLGISRSKLNDIKLINSAQPSFLQAIDNGHDTYTRALKNAKAIKKARDKAISEGEEFDESEVLNAHQKDKVVESKTLSVVCPCCDEDVKISINAKDFGKIFINKTNK